MLLVDRYSCSNRLQRMDPAQKAGLALLVVVLCLVLDRPLVGLVATGWMWALASVWAGLPVPIVGRLLMVEGLFLVMAVAGVAVSVGGAPREGSDWQWTVGPLWLGSSWASLEMAARLVCRALGCAAATSFVALSTPLVDLVELARRLRMPPLLIDLMALMYRFIFVLLDDLVRMRRAQETRLGYVSFRRSVVSTGALASRLLANAYQRSRRMQTALESRGYSGDLRVLRLRYDDDSSIYWLGTAIAVSLTLAWVCP